MYAETHKGSLKEMMRFTGRVDVNNIIEQRLV